LGFLVDVLWLRAYRLGFRRVYGFGFMVSGLGFRVYGKGFGAKALKCRV
jgi:hypothetical protein